MSTGNVSPKLSGGIIFSDGAIREHGTNKLTLIGSFQILNAPVFPFTSLPFQVTALVENLPIGEQILARVSVQSPEETELGGSAGQLKLDNMVEPRAHTELPFPVRPIVFQTPGEYIVRVLIGEQEIGRKSLFVRSVPQFSMYLPQS